jgi:hypothetical protein
MSCVWFHAKISADWQIVWKWMLPSTRETVIWREEFSGVFSFSCKGWVDVMIQRPALSCYKDRVKLQFAVCSECPFFSSTAVTVFTEVIQMLIITYWLIYKCCWRWLTADSRTVRRTIHKVLTRENFRSSVRGPVGLHSTTLRGGAASTRTNPLYQQSSVIFLH